MKIVYATGRQIVRDGNKSWGLKLPLPDGRPIEVWLDNPLKEEIHHAWTTVQVHPIKGKVFVNGVHAVRPSYRKT